jgi:hypothetical protein
MLLLVHQSLSKLIDTSRFMCPQPAQAGCCDNHPICDKAVSALVNTETFASLPLCEIIIKHGLRAGKASKSSRLRDGQAHFN